MRDLAGRELVDPPRRVIAFRPLRDDQQHRRVFGERDERLGELHRCRVGPVEVLEQDEDRAVLGETRQERCDDLERPVLERLGGELGQPGLGVGLEGQIEQRAQVRVDLGCPLAEEGLEVTAEGDPHAQLRSIHRDADPSPQEVAEGPVGQRLPVGDTAALEPDGSAVGGGRVLDLRRELGGETALADARLARHEEDAARPRERAFDGLAGFPELAFPSDELGLDALGPASGSGPNAASLERLDGLRLPLQLQLLGVAPVEQLLDLAPGFGADDDRTGIGSGLESRGRVDRVADRAVLDPAAGADRAEDDRAGRDADPRGETVDPPGAGDLRAVLRDVRGDPQPRADRALGIVLVRDGRAEEREYAVPREILDRAAEVLDRMDHARDRLADDELRILGIELLAERCRAGEVGEERGDHLALFTHLRGRRPGGFGFAGQAETVLLALMHDLGVRVVRGIALREHVAGPVVPLPSRHGRLRAGLGHEARPLDEPVLVDVARAIREDLGRADPDDELGARVLGDQRIVSLDGRLAVQPQPSPLVETDEEQARVRVDDRVSEREVHPVSVVAREGDRPLVEHAHEAGLAALVGALRPPLGVGRGEEEHVARLDESAVVVVDRLADDSFLDPLGKAARVEALLELYAGVVVEVDAWDDRMRAAWSTNSIAAPTNSKGESTRSARNPAVRIALSLCVRRRKSRTVRERK